MFKQSKLLPQQVSHLAFLAREGVEVTMLSEDRYKVHGFYKSDTVVVDFTKMEVEARYNEVTKFDEDDNLATVLAELNCKWQERSAHLADFWREPTTEWAHVYAVLDL